MILNVLKTVDMKLSYLTTGQSVPDDIEIGSATRVARLILDSITPCTTADDHLGQTSIAQASLPVRDSRAAAWPSTPGSPAGGSLHGRAARQ